jgi:excinuclease ABC subunit C
MVKADLKKQKIPASSGVYFFLGKKKEILYIGKATSLRSRIRSYFDAAITEKRGVVIEKMVDETKDIEWTVTDSVLEAMLLETNLIRTHKPRYNTRSKDDKSFNHVVITNEEYPRILIIRGKDLEASEAVGMYSDIFGPFPNGMLFKEAMKIIRKLFQFYDTYASVGSHTSKLLKGKLDFNRQIGLYPDICSSEEYMDTIKHIRLFFQGKKDSIIAELVQSMNRYAQLEKFEEAQKIKKKIFALQHIQDISLIKDETRLYKDARNLRIEAYDIAHLGGKNMVGVMTVIEGGQLIKSEYRKFHIKGFEGSDDPKALSEVLDRRLQHTEWQTPDIIVVDGSTAQKNAAQNVLKRKDMIIPVVGIVKDERHKPTRIIGFQKLITEHKNEFLLANAEAHRFAITFHRQKQRNSFMKR